MTAGRLDFPDRITLAKALAEAVAGNINAELASAGVAAIAVSGGTTPAKFFAELGKRRDIDWTKVFVTLVDERWVKSSNGKEEPRWVIHTTFVLGEVTFTSEITLTNRGGMRFPMLIGRQALRGRFLVNPGRSHLAAQENRLRARLLREKRS